LRTKGILLQNATGMNESVKGTKLQWTNEVLDSTSSYTTCCLVYNCVSELVLFRWVSLNLFRSCEWWGTKNIRCVWNSG
jgi:hypothetical protein